MRKITIQLPTEKARKYIQNKNLNKQFTEKNVKSVFTEILEQYLTGEISPRLFCAISSQILTKIHLAKSGTVKDSHLLDAIEQSSELELIRVENEDLSLIEDKLKEYYKN